MLPSGSHPPHTASGSMKTDTAEKREGQTNDGGKNVCGLPSMKKIAHTHTQQTDCLGQMKVYGNYQLACFAHRLLKIMKR